MHSQHLNSTPIERIDWMSQDHSKQPKTTTPKKSQRKIRAPKGYGFDIVSYTLQVAEEIDSFEPITYNLYLPIMSNLYQLT